MDNNIARINDNNIGAEIGVVIIKEGDYFIANSPALDLSSFGKTEKMAISNFKEALELFMETCTERNTLKKILVSCGWTQKRKQLIPPEIISTQQIPMGQLR